MPGLSGVDRKPRPRWRRTLACGLTLLLPPVLASACGGTDSDPESGPRIVEIEGPVERVTDPDLAQVMDVAEDADGTLWVLSAHPPLVRTYGPDGERQAAFGEVGQGPREFGVAQALVRPPDGSGMGVLDSQRGYLHALESDGTHRGETRVGRSMPFPHEVRFGFFGDLGRAWHTDQGVVQDLPPAFALGAASPYDFWQGTLGVIGEDDAEPRTIGRLADFAGLELSDAPDPAPRVLSAGPLLDRCPGGEFALHTGAGAEVVWVDLEGTVVNRTSVELPLSENSVETMVRWLTGISESFATGPMDSREALRERSRAVAEASEPTMEPRVPPTRLRCVEGGNVWIQLFDIDDDERGYARDWVVVDRSGVVTHRVRFPQGFSPLAFGPERVVGIHRDSLGLEMAAWVASPEVR